MINESFSWWGGGLYISKSHIKNMKKNMRKVPIIQTKSDIYHSKEDEEAEDIISGIDKIPSATITTENALSEVNMTKKNLFEKIITKLKNLFWK